MIFLSKISRSRLVISKIVSSLMFPLLIVIVLLITNGFSFNLVGLILLFLVGFIGSFTIVFLSRRYYITKIDIIDQVLVFEYLDFFKKQTITVDIQKLKIELLPIKYDKKYLSFILNPELKLKQFPFLEWDMDSIYRISEIIEKYKSSTAPFT